MSKKTGNFVIIEQFLKDNFEYMFGNPGTSEEGFLNALGSYPDLKYILTLQESIAVMIGDGYARVKQKPALVQLHSSPGIGNGVGALYQAKRGHSPLVVIGGDAGIKYMNMDSQMAGDLVAMMEPVTKYSTIAMDKDSLLRTLRRAIKIAATPPMGPVYICLPMDVLDEINNEEIFPTCIPSTRVVPEPGLVQDAARMLLQAKNPVIYIGDGVAHSGAVKEVERIAELLGAEVYGVDVGDLNIDHTHPLYMGSTGHMFGTHSRTITRKGDVNLIVGTYMLPDVFPELGNIYAEGAKIIHFDLNAYEIAKNHRVDLGVVCDPKISLALLAKELDKQISPDNKEKIQSKIEEYKRKKEEEVNKAKDEDRKKKGSTPLHMAQFAEVLAEKIPDNTIIFDEALTAFPDLVRYVHSKDPGSYFVTRGGSLGIGFPGAIGAKLACPEKTVIGFSGDGGCMYTIQTLWTAARHNTGAKFVVCNNGSYRLLQMNIDVYWKEMKMDKHDYPVCFDLSYPPIQFDQMAKSMGVDAVRVEKPEEIEPAINKMLADDKPFLVDLVLEGDKNPEKIKHTCM